MSSSGLSSTFRALATFVTTSSPSSLSSVLSATPRILIFSRLPYCSSSSTLKNVVLTICFSFSFSVLISSYFSLFSSTSSFKYSTSSTSFFNCYVNFSKLLSVLVVKTRTQFISISSIFWALIARSLQKKHVCSLQLHCREWYAVVCMCLMPKNFKRSFHS